MNLNTSINALWDFLGSDRLQETLMDALKPFHSKYVTLTMRGGFFTKLATPAHGAPCLKDHKGFKYIAEQVYYLYKLLKLFTNNYLI